nr:LytTR family DNA-binding domain-containing protein [uncultured Draconibacterium sp.]
MKIKCLIVDDEELAIDIIEDYIKRLEFLEIKGKCKNAIEALNMLNSTKVDLIFLDIQMPGLTGLQLMKNIANPPQVIFTTAYSEFALEGFELEALDYLIKPISFERFIKAVNRYFKLNNFNNLIINEKTEENSNPFIFVKSDKKMLKVFLSSITHIESIRNYVTIYLNDNSQIKTHNTISNIEQKLTEPGFLRIHRSYIVSTDKIESYTSGSVQIGREYIPISRNYRAKVIAFLEGLSI